MSGQPAKYYFVGSLFSPDLLSGTWSDPISGMHQRHFDSIKTNRATSFPLTRLGC